MSRVADALRVLFRTQDEQPTPEVLSQDSIAWSEFATYLQDVKYNPDDLIGRKGFPIYKRMMVDEQVKSGVHFKRSTVTGREWYFELDHDKYSLSEKEAERRINIYTSMIEDCYAGALTDGLNAIEKAMWQGFSLTEQIFSQFEYDGLTFWGLQELKPKPFDTFFPVVDEMGQVSRWIQRGGLGTREITLDMTKFVYYRYNPDMDEHYGWSDLRSAYRGYISKDITIKFMNIFVERLAGGFPIAKPKEGRTITRGSTEWVELVSIMRNITGKSSIILPEGIDLEVVSVSGSQVDVFVKAIETHDLSMAKALLMPNLLGMSHSGQTGSYSQSETQFDVFMIIGDEEANRLEDALNEQVFAPLGRINFADGVAPKFRFKPLSRRKRQAALDTWASLLKGGAVEASETDERHIRKMLDFPEKGEPLKKDVPTPAIVPAPVPAPQRPADEPPEPVGRSDQEERMIRMKRLGLSVEAFARAEQRVAFAVIDRQSQARVQEHVPSVEFALSEMVAEGVARIEEQSIGSDPKSVDKIAKFDFDGFRLRKLSTQVIRSLRSGLDIGEDHARREIAAAKKESDFVRLVSMDRLGDLAEQFLRAKSFTIAGDLKTGAVREIRNVLLNALKYSWTQREVQRNIYKALAAGGYLSGSTVAEALGMDDLRALAEELNLQGNLAAHRLDTVIRTNMFEAINEARFNTFTDPELDGFVVAMEYSSILDGRTTSICRHLDGRVYAADNSRIWNVYRPPNHFNCRSLLVPVTVVDKDVELTGEDPTLSPQAGFGGL